MFNHIKRQLDQLKKEAHHITKEQSLKLTDLLDELGVSYDTFFDGNGGLMDNKIIRLSNDVFIIEDYFREFRLPTELVDSID